MPRKRRELINREANGDSHSAFVVTDGDVFGDLAHEPQAVTGIDWPRQLAVARHGDPRVAPVPARDPAVGNLADQFLLRSPHPHPASARTVPHRVGGQFVDGDDNVVRAVWGHAEIGRVGADGSPELEETGYVERLVEDASELRSRRLFVTGGVRNSRRVNGHGLSPH